METRYKRDLTKDFFLPLKDWSGFSWLANHKQNVLATNLQRSYGIPIRKILALIMYVQDAWFEARIPEMLEKFPSISSDISALKDFESNPESIRNIIFVTNERSFAISNPYIIDNIYSFLFSSYFLKGQKKANKKKHSSEIIIKKIATELFNELTEVEKKSKWKSQCIIGFIFALYRIGLKNEEPTETEEEFHYKNKKFDLHRGSYLTYLTGRVKRYINN